MSDQGDGQELVSIGEAAARLGADESALRRILKRPWNAGLRRRLGIGPPADIWQQTALDAPVTSAGASSG